MSSLALKLQAMKGFYFLALLICAQSCQQASAKAVPADSSNYTGKLSSLAPGDTLLLASGTYSKDLVLNGINGTAGDPVVIRGAVNGKTRFVGRSCCNTVSITKCSWLVIEHLWLDGDNQAVDAVKAEGTAGNSAHHITVQYLNIVNYGANQQTVGISTKCHAWNWIIRRNVIDGAGTGLYLGNSTGDNPFVNGIIEYNLVKNTIGYNMEIKHQWDTVRQKFTGTNTDGKTIIRYNVFSKENNAASGASARPCVLLGAFPTTGPGASDYYEVYGNFFYQNPVEALLQVTASSAIYNNLFVNHSDGAGLRAVYITSQNGVKPKTIKVFHNTVLAANSAGGMRLYDPNTGFSQSCYGNAVFAANPISGFSDTGANMTASYATASSFVINPSAQLSLLDLFPKTGLLIGATISNTSFQAFTDYDLDFNGKAYSWTFRGAYSGSGSNTGWKLKMDTIPGRKPLVLLQKTTRMEAVSLYPNPAQEGIFISGVPAGTICEIWGLDGKLYAHETTNQQGMLPVNSLQNGCYLLRVNGIGMKIQVLH